MGRNVKPGISFYRVDSGHIMDKRVRLLVNEFDSDGYYIWSCLIDYSYSKNGYYFDTNDTDELELFSSEYCKKKMGLVKEVIAGCIRRNLFNPTIAETYGILTSEEMQDTFLIATKERRKHGTILTMIKEYILVTGETLKGHENISICPMTNADLSRDNSTDKIILDNSKNKIIVSNTDNTAVAKAPVDKKDIEKPVTKRKLRSQKAVEHWNLIVGAYLDFYKARFKDDEGNPIQPEFQPIHANFLKRIAANLKKIAETKSKEWTEQYAVFSVNYFLQKAYDKDHWLKNNFELGNLYAKYNSIVNSQPNINNQNHQTNGKNYRAITSAKHIGANIEYD